MTHKMRVRPALARGTLRATRWRLVGEVPSAGILVGAPHTSRWDWLVMLGIAWASGARPQVLVKHTYFKGPIGWVLRHTGGIELDRENPGATIRALLKEAEGDEPFLLTIAPKGTRSKVEYWKPGSPSRPDCRSAWASSTARPGASESGRRSIPPTTSSRTWISSAPSMPTSRASGRRTGPNRGCVTRNQRLRRTGADAAS